MPQVSHSLGNRRRDDLAISLLLLSCCARAILGCLSVIMSLVRDVIQKLRSEIRRSCRRHRSVRADTPGPVLAGERSFFSPSTHLSFSFLAIPLRSGPSFLWERGTRLFPFSAAPFSCAQPDWRSDLRLCSVGRFISKLCT